MNWYNSVFPGMNNKIVFVLSKFAAQYLARTDNKKQKDQEEESNMSKQVIPS